LYLETKIDKNIIEIAQKVLQHESEAINSLISTIDQGFVDIVENILASKGKLVLSGIGKSAIIAQKIVATLTSTGQAATFMHAADALHGDLGIINSEDIVLVISKSGNTAEIKVLLPLIKNLGNKIIGMVSETDSYLGKQADFLINAHVEKEACPLNLAPTTSTTVALALGDALAVCLLEARDFEKENFAKYHPGGALGKKLYLRCSDLAKMHDLPSVSKNATLAETILEMSSKRLGATAVLDENQELAGIVTDGDLRRMLNENTDFGSIKAADIMNPNPKTIANDEYAVNALFKMKEYSVSQLVVLDGKNVKGFIHIHDLIKEGLV
jgi:arabinose-5-phosphate isomerase